MGEAVDAEEEKTNAAPVARQYGDVAAIYDTLMTSVPHGAWLSRIEQIVRARGRQPRSALDVACGTGLVTEELARRGYAPVYGVDLSGPMLAIARTKARAKELDIPYIQQDAAALDLPVRPFDLVVSLFDSLNYVVEPERLQAAFRRIFDHTAPGGVFAFDLNALYALANRFFDQSGVYGPIRHEWRSFWDRETRLCRVEMDFWVRDRETGAERHFAETHVQRAYTVPEITEWLGAAGFSPIEVFGNYANRPPGPKTDRLLFVAERA